MPEARLLSNLFVAVALVELLVCHLGETQSTRRPDPTTWATDEAKDRLGFLDWLIRSCSSINGDDGCRSKKEEEPEYEGFDGWYNNPARPSLGAVDTPLLRLLSPAYNDGVYEPTNRSANPLALSDKLMAGDSGSQSMGGRTAFQVFFGQQVVEEVLDAQGAGCPPEYHNIPIEEGHEYHRQSPHLKEMPFLRTRYDLTSGFSPNNPRQQLNEITPYLDGGLVYGTSKAWTDVLRTFPNGTLAPYGQLAWHDELGPGFPAQNTHRLPLANPPPPTNHFQYVKQGYTVDVDRFFKLGNPRGNENPFLLTFGVLWFRWHNHIARYLAQHNSDWSDERVFNEARKWVIATYQAVVFYDWLPKYVRSQPREYQGYKVSTDPQISHVFQSAAMRFGHTLVTSGVHLRSRSSEGCFTIPFAFTPGSGHLIEGVRTCNSFWRSPELFTAKSSNFEQFLMGLSSQSSEKEDNIVVRDLRGRVFGPLEFSRRDLMAINIQRGRDHGLPDYNTARHYFNLEPLTSLDPKEFKSKTSSEVDEKVLERLKEVYQNDPSKVDIWVGGLLETHDSGPGDLFLSIILDQFERIREGDRFWFENTKNKLFTIEEQERIKQTRIIDVLLSVTTLLPGEDIQMDPFTAVHDGNLVSEVCHKKLVSETSCNLPLGNGNKRCLHLPQISINSEPCTPPNTYDHFSGSEVSYILTFTLVCGACVGMFICIIIMSAFRSESSTKAILSSLKLPDSVHKAKEKVSRLRSRYVMLELDEAIRHIQVRDIHRNLLRTIDLSSVKEVTIRHLQDYRQLVIRVVNHYDLNLVFGDPTYGRVFYKDFEKFCGNLGLHFKHKLESLLSIQNGVTTVYERQKKLTELCRFVMLNAYRDKDNIEKAESIITRKMEMQDKDFSIELTLDELASELGMQPDNVFVKQLFRRMDADKNGFVTIKELWDVMLVLAQGTQEEKARLAFDIYDINQSNSISMTDLSKLVKSSSGSDMKEGRLKEIVRTMMKSVGMKEDEEITFENFRNIVLKQGNIFSKVSLETRNKRPLVKSFSWVVMHPMEKNVDTDVEEEEDEENEGNSVLNSVQMGYYGLISKIYGKIQYVFWLVLYTLVMFVIFAERAYYFSVEREHRGLRQIVGYGVAVTRGAASAMMFTYSTLLVTMCRNIFSILRSTALHRLVPFDHMVSLHRYIAFWAVVWTAMHVIGHSINFYHISTQTPPDLTCLFRDFFRSSHVLPKFHYWCWETITGITGVLLTLQTAVIYVFAYWSRKNFFRAFWFTHNTYPIFYLLIVLHGSGRLVQPPFFYYFFLGPCVLFLLDKLVSISRNKIKIDILKVTMLPSDVIRLEIRRPPSFSFHSGQWVKIASTAISEQEYHPFTLSSPPHQKNLTVHIRGVGPWTRKLIEMYSEKTEGGKYPEIYMDGPFGEGHQTWWDYEVVVLVAGGIGVTPFASILRDMAHKLANSRKLKRTKKVLFLWTTRSQRQQEWMMDILREVELMDKDNIIGIHIFITQFKSKFDLRTIILYMTDRYYQVSTGLSIFTDLRAITHFGRPNFDTIFKTLKKKYKPNIVGVFSCGSSALSHSVERSCQDINCTSGTIFRHYYKNY